VWKSNTYTFGVNNEITKEADKDEKSYSMNPPSECRGDAQQKKE
jgi:hypothetical protein